MSAGAVTSPRSDPAGAKKTSLIPPGTQPADELDRALCVGRADPQRDDPRAVVRFRRERHVGDVDARATQRQGDRRHDARLVGDRDADLASGPAEEPHLEQRRAPDRRGRLPHAQPVAVAVAVEQGAHLPQPAHEVVDLRAERDAVGAVDLLPQRRVRARDARRVAKRRPGRGQRLAVERLGRLLDEQVRDDVRQVRHGRHQAVVVGGRDRRRHRAEARDEAREALVEHAGRALAGRQVPRRAVEEILARMRDTGRLGAGERVAADEVLASDGLDERLLRRADVRDDRARQPVAEVAHRAGERVDRHGRDRDVGLSEIVQRRDCLVDRAHRKRGLKRGGAAVPAHDPRPQAPARRQPDRAADEPDAEQGDARLAHTLKPPRGGREPTRRGRRAPRRSCPSRCTHR